MKGLIAQNKRNNKQANKHNNIDKQTRKKTKRKKSAWEASLHINEIGPRVALWDG